MALAVAAAAQYRAGQCKKALRLGRGLKKVGAFSKRKDTRASQKRMGGNILRAFRPSGVHERVARARRTWGELSLTEQIAVGVLGGLGALTAARLLLGPRGDETSELVDQYAKAGAKEKGVIAGLCTSRVHDLRDLLLDTKRAKVARMIFDDVEMSLNRATDDRYSCSREAQLEFISDALSPSDGKFEPGFGAQPVLWDNVHMTHSIMLGRPSFPPEYRGGHAMVRVHDGATIPSDLTVERWKLQQIPKRRVSPEDRGGEPFRFRPSHVRAHRSVGRA
jgi:hypothetical protein